MIPLLSHALREPQQERTSEPPRPCAGWLESLIGVQVLRGIVRERAEAIALRINDKLRDGHELSEFERMVVHAAVRCGSDTRHWLVEAA